MNSHFHATIRWSRLVMPATLAFLTVTSAFGVELINFNSDSTGTKPNGFFSVDSTRVSFTDTVGANLDVSNYGSQSNNTNALAVNTDLDGSVLQMNFTSLVTSLSLDFGNDDPCCTIAGDLALLTTYVGATQVGQTSIVLNRDDIMNQSISIGGFFDRATFGYTNAAGSPFTGINNSGLIEVVDNIRFTPIPEPSTLILLALGLYGGVLRYRRR